MVKEIVFKDGFWFDIRNGDCFASLEHVYKQENKTILVICNKCKTIQNYNKDKKTCSICAHGLERGV